MAVFDSLDRDLMNSTADLQSELLAFAHDSTIDDGVTGFRIDNNCGNDECGRGNRRSMLALRQFRSRFPSDRPKWITLICSHVEGRLVLQFDLWRFIRHGKAGAENKAEIKELLHFL